VAIIGVVLLATSSRIRMAEKRSGPGAMMLRSNH
jgi:hypothetical protein